MSDDKNSYEFHKKNILIACEVMTMSEVINIVLKRAIIWRDISCNQKSKVKWRKVTNKLDEVVNLLS